MSVTDSQKARARAWYFELQKKLFAAFEQLEEEADEKLYPGAPGKFEAKPWSRGDGSSDQGGGIGGFLRGRFFEKVGVHVSNVYGELSKDFAPNVAGAADDPRFWSAGLSLIAHLRNPHCPAAHMNTRHMITTKWWFGGGGDLNPTQDYQRSQDFIDAKEFHAAFKTACDKHGDNFQRYKEWCDEYFFAPHRNEPRGVGGIFYDHHNTGDWEKDFAFNQDVGLTFLDIYPKLLRTRMNTPWTEADRDEQLIRRGRYAEFNLLYDRGTMFGLKTAGNIETILSSLPPHARWP
ncbi:MAG: oxygen-dependent coproporphyrinogen oxidase [Caulobacterales bacterium]